MPARENGAEAETARGVTPEPITPVAKVEAHDTTAAGATEQVAESANAADDAPASVPTAQEAADVAPAPAEPAMNEATIANTCHMGSSTPTEAATELPAVAPLPSPSPAGTPPLADDPATTSTESSACIVLDRESDEDVGDDVAGSAAGSRVPADREGAQRDDGTDERRTEDSIFGEPVRTFCVNCDASNRHPKINTPKTQADAIVDLIKRGPLPHLVTLTETAIRAAEFVADALGFSFRDTGERSNRVVTLWDPDRFELLPPPGSRDVGVVDSYQHRFHVAYLRHITSGSSLAYASAHMPHKKNKDTAWANLAEYWLLEQNNEGADADAFLLAGDLNEKPSQVRDRLKEVSVVTLFDDNATPTTDKRVIDNVVTDSTMERSLTGYVLPGTPFTHKPIHATTLVW